MKKNLLFCLSVASIFYVGCYKESNYDKPLDPSLYKISAEKNEILADGFQQQKYQLKYQ